MARLLITPILATIFFVWLLYRLLIRKDLKKHYTEMAFGFIFITVWFIIFWFMLK